MNVQDALRLYHRFQEHHQGVFLITRNCDAKMFLYIAQREGNALVGNKVKCIAVMAPDWKKEEPISQVVMDNFFALNLEPVQGSSKHIAHLVAFPKRNMTLHLKKNSSEGKSDGHVTATTAFMYSKTVKINGEEQVKTTTINNVQLLSLHQIMTFDELEIPDISRVYLYGCVNKNELKDVDPEVIVQHCTSFSETQYLIEEIVCITEEMRKRFDVKALAAQWCMTKLKLGS